MRQFNAIRAVATAVAIAVFTAPALAQNGTLTIDVGHPGAKSSPLFYGLMTEEINHAYDGGLYAELIQNRSLEDNANAPAHWSAVTEGGGAATISLDKNNPVPGTVLKNSLRVDIAKAGGASRAGAANDGFWGIPVRPFTRYRASLYAKASPGFAGPLTVALQSADGTKTYAQASVPALSENWRQYTIYLSAKETPISKDNRLAVLASSAGTVWLTQVSLFPPTFNGRPNGSRPDLMQKMIDMHPSFLRLPGGNYLEGVTIPGRFNWKETLGPVSQRPGNPGTWGYHSSTGLGLLEFLEWCEDAHMEPVLAVWAGYALNGTHVDSGSALTPYVQDALDEIQYVTGDKSTLWGARRVRDGHPAPFPLHYVEIGNEDFFDKSGSYDRRFAQFADAIKAKYPRLQTIATEHIKNRTPDLIDDHYYRSAIGMENDVHHYDNVPRTGSKIFVGEWATIEGSPTPNFHAALADAAWLTGLERNSDLVVLESYAPLLVNVSPTARQWGTNLIGFDVLNSFGSPSYYMQAMFAQNKGDTILPVQITPAPDTSAPPAPPAPHGQIGVGTWRTQAEFRDVTVTHAGQALYQSDFAQGDPGWKFGDGTWAVKDSALQQTGSLNNSIATVGDLGWTDYTLHLQARKLGGEEGFLILFHALNDDTHLWWNIGGWGNTRTNIENKVSGSSAEIGHSVPVTVETGRWYDIRIDVQGRRIQGFLDGKLVSDTTDTLPPPPAPLYASAVRQSQSGNIIVKVVNISDSPQPLLVALPGAKTIGKDAALTTLTGQNEDVNSLDAPRLVAPVSTVLHGIGVRFTHTFPARSISILRIKARP